MSYRSAIMYQNASGTITLLDLPLSIALAQGANDEPCSRYIYSSPALEEPWPSTEPKSFKAKAHIAAYGMISKNGSEEQEFLQTALEELHENWKDEWCLERKINPNFLEPTIPFTGYDKSTKGPRSGPLVLQAPLNSQMRPSDLHTWPVHNSTANPIALPVEETFVRQAEGQAQSVSATYHVPVSHRSTDRLPYHRLLLHFKSVS